MSFSPIMNQMFSQMALNVLNVLMEEEVKNPYLKAALAPVVQAFSDGILNGLLPQDMARQAAGQLGKEAPVSEQDLAGFYESAIQNTH